MSVGVKYKEILEADPEVKSFILLAETTEEAGGFSLAFGNGTALIAVLILFMRQYPELYMGMMQTMFGIFIDRTEEMGGTKNPNCNCEHCQQKRKAAPAVMGAVKF